MKQRVRGMQQQLEHIGTAHSEALGALQQLACEQHAAVAENHVSHHLNLQLLVMQVQLPKIKHLISNVSCLVCRM